MGFQTGDMVIHRSHGLGQVVGMEERVINERATSCYVVQTASLTIWVPVDGSQGASLRAPTPPDEFSRLKQILNSPGEQLQTDRVERKNQLMAQMTDGQLASLFQVVRDLTHYKRKTKLNEPEKTILERAMNTLITEWTYSLGVPAEQAQTELLLLLDT